MSHRARIWIGVVVALLGAGIGGAMLVGVFVQVNDDVRDLHRFGARADGGTLVVEEPLEATIFVEPQSRSLAGVRYRIIRVASATILEVDPPPSPSFSYDFPSGSGRSIAQVSLAPGEYVVEVESGDVTIAIGSNPAPSLGDLARAAMYGGTLVVVGAALALIAAIRQTRARTQLASSTLGPPHSGSPSAWVTGTWDESARSDETER